MKSWGERLVAGLKSWRSRRNDVVPDKAAEGSRAMQPDQKPIEAIVNDQPTEVDENASQASPQADSANILPKEQAFDEVSRAHGIAIAEPEQKGGKAIQPSIERCEPEETTDEQITDEQLAELEAENVRLKLLLRDKLSSDQNHSL